MTEHIEQRRRWHVSREISLDAIIAFMTACGAVIIAWVNLNSRLSVVEASIASITAEAIKRAEDARTAATILGVRLDRMDDKLDRLIERKK